jgi:hypothetical protein
MTIASLPEFICLKRDVMCIKFFLTCNNLLKLKFGRKIITMQTDLGGKYEKLTI